MSFHASPGRHRWYILLPNLGLVGELSSLAVYQNRYILIVGNDDQIISFDFHLGSTHILPSLPQLSLLCSVTVAGDFLYVLTWAQDHIYRINISRPQESIWERLDWNCPVKSIQRITSYKRELFSFSFEGNAIYHIDTERWTNIPNLPQDILITISITMGQHVFVGGTPQQSTNQFMGALFHTNSRTWDNIFSIPFYFYCGTAVRDDLLVLAGKENEEQMYLTFMLFDLKTREIKRSYVIYPMHETDRIGMVHVVVVGNSLVLAGRHLESISLEYLLTNSIRVES